MQPVAELNNWHQVWVYFCFLLEFLAGESLERDFIVPRTTSSLQPRQHASPAVTGNDILMEDSQQPMQAHQEPTVYVKKRSKCSWVSVASTDPRAYIGAVADYDQQVEELHGDVKETDSSSRVLRKRQAVRILPEMLKYKVNQNKHNST